MELISKEPICTDRTSKPDRETQALIFYLESKKRERRGTRFLRYAPETTKRMEYDDALVLPDLRRNGQKDCFGGQGSGRTYMGFFTSAISILQTLVSAIGAGLGVWGVINLLEGYGNDNPGAKSQGIKQLMAGGGVILIGTQLVPQLSGLFG